MTTETAQAGVAAVLEPVLAAMPVATRPRFIASLERLAALRYREWAAACNDLETRDCMLACAKREDEIADLVCGVYPQQDGEAELFASLADAVRDGTAALFGGKTPAQQYAAQAAGERVGAATWRALARTENARARLDTLERCAQLEEENARFLESLA